MKIQTGAVEVEEGEEEEEEEEEAAAAAMEWRWQGGRKTCACSWEDCRMDAQKET